jgi:hypothetical protein
MKLLVNTKAGRVLYAEAGKDVVDFLFSLLTLLVGAVVKMLSKDAMVGCIGYGSGTRLLQLQAPRRRLSKSSSAAREATAAATTT